MSDDNIFPFGFDEEELREELARRAKALRPRDIESAQIDVPFVQLGIVDLQSRITSKLTGLVEAQSRSKRQSCTEVTYHQWPISANRNSRFVYFHIIKYFQQQVGAKSTECS